jgi:hypothetical protein
MYSVFRNCNDNKYSVCWNNEKGIIIPYHQKSSRYIESDKNDPKYHYYWNDTDRRFFDWVHNLTNSSRRSIKRKVINKMNTIVNSEVKDTGWINAGPETYVRSIVATSMADKFTVRAIATQTRPDKEDTMNTERTYEETQRDYLKRDVTKSYYQHVDTLNKKYLSEDIPESVEEIVRRIKADEFKLVEPKARSRGDYSWSNFIWRTEETDRPAYQKAVDELENDLRHVNQDVMVLPLEKAMRSVRDFEKVTLH